MRYLRLAGVGLLVAATVLGAGYLWGGRGRWAAEEQLAAMHRQLGLSEARRLALAGQMALARLNFGEASGLFESARASVETVRGRLEQDGQLDAAGQAAAAVTQLTEARTRASRLDPAAAGKAGEAVSTLDRLATALPAQPR